MRATTSSATAQAIAFGHLVADTGQGLLPRGLAALAVQHLEEFIAALSPADREFMVGMLQHTIDELTAEEPTTD